ncbi:MAG: helix-turn-helix domain-containing protein, partial [Streptosporangiaceae bacterium]
MESSARARKPLPQQLTDAERVFYGELRRLASLAGFSSRMLERNAAGLGGYGRSQWDRWLNGEARPPVQVIRNLAELLGVNGIEAGHLPGLWARAFAAAPAAGPGERPLPRPCQLPPSVAHFTGRAAELRVLAGLADLAAVAGGAVVITAIGGTAGVGKTALAVHWAHQAAGRFPDGQLYVNLRGYDPAGDPAAPAEAIRWLLDALAVPAAQFPAGLQAQTGLYRSLLAGKQMLIVLDNARDPAQVRPLLPGTPGSMVLITSRSQLTGLAAADGASLITLD